MLFRSLPGRELARIRQDGQRIAAEFPVGKDVDGLKGIFHGADPTGAAALHRTRITWRCTKFAFRRALVVTAEGNSLRPMTQTSSQISYDHGVSTKKLIGETIGNFFDKIVEKYRDREALVVKHQNVRWSWGELRSEEHTSELQSH